MSDRHINNASMYGDYATIDNDMLPRAECEECARLGTVCHTHLLVQYVHVKYLINDLSAAIKREGPNPKKHRRIMLRHRKSWPTLWKKIDRLLEWGVRHS